MIGHFAPGIEIPLHPFFGSMGVAGPAGKIGSTEPFAHAGNMDNKELVAGTTLYIPVAAKGAMFEAGRWTRSTGQRRGGYYGNGDISHRYVQVHRPQEKEMNWPRAETPTHDITMGLSPDLKEATEHALRDMIDFLVENKHMTRDDAYMLSSMAVDLDITELVDGNVKVHAMCPKHIFIGTLTK